MTSAPSCARCRNSISIPPLKGFENAVNRRPLPANANFQVQAGASLPQFTFQVNQAVLKQAQATGLPVHSDAKTVRAAAEAAKNMNFLSTNLRSQGLISVTPTLTSFVSSDSAATPDPTSQRFEQWCDQNHVETYAGTLPTMVQMMQVESPAIRSLLVQELAKVNTTESSALLARRALFELSPEVRKSAVEELKKRRPETYRPILLDGFRYPWAPVADHAAEALLLLDDQGSVPVLEKLLDQPDPSGPTNDGPNKSPQVRELVRINHLRNCYLCHAASPQQTDLVRGLVPKVGQALPVAYYASQQGDFVRADITYLRQDFSLVDTVLDPGPWPAEQRYDYVVRTRKPTPQELESAKNRSTADYPQREAVLETLRGLTGHKGETNSAGWQVPIGVVKEPAKTAKPSSGPVDLGNLAADLAKESPRKPT